MHIIVEKWNGNVTFSCVKHLEKFRVDNNNDKFDNWITARSETKIATK
jgi:hypothetical protein